MTRPRSRTFQNIWSATTSYANLVALCEAACFNIRPDQLPLDQHGRLLPQIRFLRFGWLHTEGSKSDKSAFPKGVHTVAQCILPSNTLEHLSLDARIPDALRILGYAAGHSGLRSLHIEGTTTADAPPSLEESVQLATTVLSFVHLRELRIPSRLINAQTLPLFASLQALKRLDLVAQDSSCWKTSLDDWTGLVPLLGGFPSLMWLGLHKVEPAQMELLVLSGCFATWPRTVEVSGVITERQWSNSAYRSFFRNMSLVCGQVENLRLAICYLDIDPAVLKELAVLQQLEEVQLLATEADALSAAASLWPNARILPLEQEVDVFPSVW
jgi:hypothetical protein